MFTLALLAQARSTTPANNDIPWPAITAVAVGLVLFGLLLMIVKRSIVLDSKADLVVYGMGEHAIVEIARRMAAGKTVKDLRDLRGVAYALGAKESEQFLASGGRKPPVSSIQQETLLPSYDEVRADKRKFAEAAGPEPVEQRVAGNGFGLGFDADGHRHGPSVRGVGDWRISRKPSTGFRAMAEEVGGR